MLHDGRAAGVRRAGGSEPRVLAARPRRRGGALDRLVGRREERGRRRVDDLVGPLDAGGLETALVHGPELVDMRERVTATVGGTN